MLFVTNLILSVTFFPFIYSDLPKYFTLNWFDFFMVTGTGLLWFFSGILGNKSYESAPISIREPLSQLQIVVALIIGVIIFSESLTLAKVLGAGLIVFAGFLLSLGKFSATSEVTSSGIILILTYTVVSASVAALDKHNLTLLPTSLYMFLTFFLANICMLPALNRDKFEKIKETILNKKLFFYMSLLSVYFFLAYYLALLCYKNFEYSVAYPILKLAAPLAAVCGILFLGEKNNWKLKAFSILLALFGAYLIKLW